VDLYSALRNEICSALVILVSWRCTAWTRDQKVADSTPGRGAIKSTKSTQPSIPPG